MVLSNIAVEDYIANLTLSLIGEDGDLVWLIEVVVLERQVVQALPLLGLADRQTIHDFLIFLLRRVAHPETCHDVTKVFVIVCYDGLDAHAWFVVHQQLGEVGH